MTHMEHPSELYKQWMERLVPIDHCMACSVNQAVGHSEHNENEIFCTQRCLEHFHRLKLGHKRLLEIDTSGETSAWDQLPDEIVVALLEVMFPRRETSVVQFRSLSRFRLMGDRYRRLIDERIYHEMQELPREIGLELDDEKLQPFRGLKQLVLYNDTRVSSTALGKMTQLTVLQLEGKSLGVEHNIVPDTLCLLPRLQKLTLIRFHHRTVFHYERLSSSLYSLSLGNDQCLVQNRLDKTVDLTPLVGLRELHLTFTREIDDSVLRPLTQLTSLRASHIAEQFIDRLDEVLFSRITDHGISTLTNLQMLALERMPRVQCHFFHLLTNIRELTLQRGRIPLDERIGRDIESHLTRLTGLVLKGCDFNSQFPMELDRMGQITVLATDCVTNKSVEGLTQLRVLVIRLPQLGREDRIRLNDNALKHLSSLRRLDLPGGVEISAEGLKYLHSLQYLDLKDNRFIPTTAFIMAHQWFPSLKGLVIENSLVSQNYAFYPVVRTNSSGDVIRFDSTLKDHLPVGCRVFVNQNSQFIVLDRVDGQARIEFGKKPTDIVRNENAMIIDV